jgi:hypothetical protein
LRPNKLEFGRSLLCGLSSIFTWAWKRTCSTRFHGGAVEQRF